MAFLGGGDHILRGDGINLGTLYSKAKKLFHKSK